MYMTNKSTSCREPDTFVKASCCFVDCNGGVCSVGTGCEEIQVLFVLWFCVVGRIVLEVSKYFSVLICTVRQSKDSYGCLKLKVKTQRTYRKVEQYATSQCRIQETISPTVKFGFYVVLGASVDLLFKMYNNWIFLVW